MLPKDEDFQQTSSIIWRLIIIFRWDIIFSMSAKFFADLLTFSNPYLLKKLIKFTQNSTEPLWIGVALAVSMFLTSEFSSLLQNYYYYIMFRAGTRVQSILSAAVYKKTMQLSNASRREKTVGEIVNLMAIDIDRFQQICPQTQQFWSTPLQICLALILLWGQVGVAVFSGMTVMFLLLPVNFLITMQTRRYQVRQMYFKDERTKMVNEVLNGIKVIKLYAWEVPMERTIVELRNRELSLIRKAAILRTFSDALNTASPFLVALSTFATYIFMDANNVLTPEIAFVSLTLFNQLRTPMSTVAELISQTVQRFDLIKRSIGYGFHVQVNVSNRRLKAFFEAEKLETYVEESPDTLDDYNDSIEIKGFSATWERTEFTPTLQNISMNCPRGSFIAIVGRVGSGKSSLLSAMLGEMERISGRIGVCGRAAYVPQQAWMQNETVRNNIIFGLPYDSVYYNKIIAACQLTDDLNVLTDADQTEIGEKGINLSGGQKARISLARAVYQNHDIYLMDDPLSAVDSHVGANLFKKVLGPEGMLRNKTRVLVTNELSYLKYAERIFIMADGKLVSSGTYTELMDSGKLARLMEECKTERQNREADGDREEDVYISDDETFGNDETFDQRSIISTISGYVPRRTRNYSSNKYKQLYHHRRRLSTSRSVVSVAPNLREEQKVVRQLTGVERMETGRVKFAVYAKYFKAMGIGCSILFLIGMVTGTFSSICRNLWLTDWSNDDKANHGAPMISIYNRLGVYAVIGFTEVFLMFFGMVALLFGGELASRNLHAPLIHAIFRAPMSFFDTTPFGRILNRVGKDIETVDFLLPYNAQFFVQCVLQVASTLIIIMVTTPMFCALILPLTIMYCLVMRSYVATSRQLKRLEAVTRSPIYSHLSESINGAPTIRGFNMVPKFRKMSEKKVEANVECRYLNNVANRWLSIRLEFIGNCVVLFAAMFAAMYRDSISAGMLGLSVSYALNITFVLNFAVRQISKLESNIVSVERILEYTDTPPEADWNGGFLRPEPDWPQNGRITFDDYHTRYRPELDPVLKHISVEIEPGEKVGIVGRTGAGKSSVTLALFRMLEASEGTIMIDGVDISLVGLHVLRSNITIIPQDPVLFSGTLRFNLDPFGRYTDDEIWSALESADLKHVAELSPLKLNQMITEGGDNISIGQRQLVCLARAILRKAKILVLDEATAAVDVTTDSLIQQTIREKFADSTIITIAHRLNTILDYDQIIVLENGQIREFGSPQVLLADRTSQFFAMVNSGSPNSSIRTQ